MAGVIEVARASLSPSGFSPDGKQSGAQFLKQALAAGGVLDQDRSRMPLLVEGEGLAFKLWRTLTRPFQACTR
jgi:hypothetical protein